MFSGLVKLGEGASGQVFSGIDRETGRAVAIKVAPASDLSNLKVEIALQKMSSHPNVVRTLPVSCAADAVRIMSPPLAGCGLYVYGQVNYIETYLHKDQLWVRKL
jgi:serine/threonine protein kinase